MAPERFSLPVGDATFDLRERAKDGAVPVLEGLELDSEGPALLGMERRWTDIELTDAKFTDYLEHEGLTTITALRDEQGHREVERECYTRGLKSLVRVGAGKDRAELHRRVLGHRIEIVLLDDGELRARSGRRVAPASGAHGALPRMLVHRLGELLDELQLRVD